MNAGEQGASAAGRGAGAAVVALLVLEVVLLAAAARFGDFTQPMHARICVGLLVASGVAFLAAAWQLGRGWMKPAVVFWAGAVAIRLVLMPMMPGDDFWRYAWEGRVQVAGFNPYVAGPMAPELEALRTVEWARINHPESPAIYPPGAELLFAALVQISDATWFFKAIFALCDLVTCAVLLRILPEGMRYAGAAWFAWNPAVAYASAGGGHFDSVMVAAMSVAIYGLQQALRGGRVQPGWASMSAVALGGAIAIKLVPVFLLPVWALALRRSAWLLAPAVLLPAALTIPFGGAVPVLKPLLAFADITRFHDLFWWLVELVTVPNPWQRNMPFTRVLLLVCAVLAIRFRTDWQRSALWVLGAALILSPVLHPWYVTWILPLACLRRQHGWTLLSLSALAALLLWETTAWWTAWEPNWVTRIMVIAPALGAWWLGRRCFGPRVTGHTEGVPA